MQVAFGVEPHATPEIANMKRRRIVSALKTGSITLPQARRAARSVKMAKLRRRAAGKDASSSKTDGLVPASIYERYLGHFGAAPRNTSRKNASGAKGSAARKSAAKKAAPK